MTITIDTFLERAPQLLQDWRPEHTQIQMQHFVVGNSGCGDPWGKYVQAMRELEGRYQGARAMDLQREALELALEEAEIEAEAAEEPALEEIQAGELGRRRYDVRRARAQLDVRIAQAAIDADAPRRAAALREAATVLQLATDARAAVGELTDERRTEMEWQFTATRFAQKINFQRMAGVAVGEEIMLSIQHFPEKQKAQLVEALGTVVGSTPNLRDPMQGALQLAFASKDRRDRDAAAIAGSG